MNIGEDFESDFAENSGILLVADESQGGERRPWIIFLVEKWDLEVQEALSQLVEEHAQGNLTVSIGAGVSLEENHKNKCAFVGVSVQSMEHEEIKFDGYGLVPAGILEGWVGFLPEHAPDSIRVSIIPHPRLKRGKDDQLSMVFSLTEGEEEVDWKDMFDGLRAVVKEYYSRYPDYTDLYDEELYRGVEFSIPDQLGSKE